MSGRVAYNFFQQWESAFRSGSLLFPPIPKGWRVVARIGDETILEPVMPTGTFKARVWICGATDEFDGYSEIQDVWDDELTPTTEGQRSTADWAKEHLDNWGLQEWLDAANLPKQGNFEILILKAVIVGRMSGAPGNEDWDEEVQIIELLTQPLPDNWFASVEPEPESDPNGRCELCGGFKHHGEHGDGTCNVPDVQL